MNNPKQTDRNIFTMIMNIQKCLRLPPVRLHCQLRQRLMVSANRTTARFDALMAPTIPIVAPTIAEMQSSDENFYRINALLLRNCAPFNVLDRPCWSLPCHPQGSAPVGLMVVGETLHDKRLQAIGLAIETALKAKR